REKTANSLTVRVIRPDRFFASSDLLGLFRHPIGHHRPHAFSETVPVFDPPDLTPISTPLDTTGHAPRPHAGCESCGVADPTADGPGGIIASRADKTADAKALERRPLEEAHGTRGSAERGERRRSQGLPTDQARRTTEAPRCR